MGGKPTKELRPIVDVGELQFLDLVLIQSTCTTDGFDFDGRVASTVKHASNGVCIDDKYALTKWDRIGFIQVPTYLEPWQYGYDNIEVTQATDWGVTTKSLRTVCEQASMVAIRRIVLKNGETAASAAAGLVDADKAAAAAANVASARTVEDLLNADSSDEEDDGDVHDYDKDMLDSNKERRSKMQNRYYALSGRVVNRPFRTSREHLPHMFARVRANLRESSGRASQFDEEIELFFDAVRGVRDERVKEVQARAVAAEELVRRRRAEVEANAAHVAAVAQAAAAAKAKGIKQEGKPQPIPHPVLTQMPTPAEMAADALAFESKWRDTIRGHIAAGTVVRINDDDDAGRKGYGDGEPVRASRANQQRLSMMQSRMRGGLVAGGGDAGKKDDGEPEHGHGLTYDELVLYFGLIADAGHIKNTLAESEVFHLVTQYDTHRDGEITKAELTRCWRSSATRAVLANKRTAELLSGYFVSQALQQVGLLPRGTDAEKYFLPAQFSYVSQHDKTGTVTVNSDQLLDATADDGQKKKKKKKKQGDEPVSINSEAAAKQSAQDDARRALDGVSAERQLIFCTLSEELLVPRPPPLVQQQQQQQRT